MSTRPLSVATMKEIEAMVALYAPRRTDFANLAERMKNELMQHAELSPLIHSTKQREKHPDHLRKKLIRKALEARDKAGRAITRHNFFKKIGDLAGVRLLHIHTDQLARIHPTIVKILNFYKYRFREKPKVYIWDHEREEFLKKLGLDVVVRANMYTSVHYVVESCFEPIACEIQVRTLAEELWGEVSHTVNYPDQTESVACKEQLAALARVASGCTRLVDSIFASEAEHKAKAPAARAI